MKTNGMKALAMGCAAVLSCGVLAAQEPHDGMQPHPAADTLRTEVCPEAPHPAGEVRADPLAGDLLWQEAVCDGGLNFRVFGRRARNDEAFAALTARFEACDTTLLFSDFLTLYYGRVYRDDYAGGYGIGLSQQEMEADPAGCYEKTQAALRRDPASPRLLRDALSLAEALGRPLEERQSLYSRREAILLSIYSLGRGTRQHPFFVACVTDEYDLMYSLLGVERVDGQTLVTEMDVSMDCISVDPVDNGRFSGDEVWFDVTFPYLALSEPRKWAALLEAEQTGSNE